MEHAEPSLSPEESQQRLNEAFAGVRAPKWRATAQPPPEPPPKLTPEQIQERFDELFAVMPSRPEPIPPPQRPDPATPEELQQRLNEAFAGVKLSNSWPSPKPPPELPPKLTAEEIQQQLDEAFGPWEWLKSHPSAGRSPRRLRSLFRAGNLATGGPARRQRCDAQVKNLFKIGKNGGRVTRGPFCKGWAMENGRCWMHGGASTGPKCVFQGMVSAVSTRW